MYRTIVVGTDCSSTADRAVRKAAEIAKLTGATVHLVSAYSGSVAALAAASGAAGVLAADRPDVAIHEQTARVDAMADCLRVEGIETTARVEHGTAANTLVSVADDVGADLLVVGDRGLKGLRGILGSVPNRVTHQAQLDVLVVHTT
jgi:nucleotide-binding universal stress UspA family protein